MVTSVEVSLVKSSGLALVETFVELATVGTFAESMSAECSKTRSFGQLVEGRHDERENLRPNWVEHWTGSKDVVESGLFESAATSVD